MNIIETKAKLVTHMYCLCIQINVKLVSMKNWKKKITNLQQWHIFANYYWLYMKIWKTKFEFG